MQDARFSASWQAEMAILNPHVGAPAPVYGGFSADWHTARNPFSRRKRVSGRPPVRGEAAEDGGRSGNMRIVDSRLA